MPENLPTLTATLFVALENVLQELLDSGDSAEKTLDTETQRLSGKERYKLTLEKLTSTPVVNPAITPRSNQMKAREALLKEINQSLMEQRQDDLVLQVLSFQKDGEQVEECKAVAALKVRVLPNLEGYVFAGIF